MRKARLLSTVAATLLLTVGAASAQELKKDAAPTPAPAALQNAPAEKIAPAMKPGEQKAGAQQKAPETTGQGAVKPSDRDAAPRAAAPDSKGDVKNEAMPKTKDQKASENAGAKEAAPAPAKSAAEEKAGTSGQGAASGSAKLSTEQHTKITAIIKQQKVAPAQLSVSIRVGTRVPDSVRFYPLPQEVFVIYPAWRGYDYILVGDQIIVIDPRTHEIVAILEA